ncbi:MAG: GNAT family N-acetyltransferase [Candidatus Thermoplasmatota archaeon]|nr:GNAT family N-acetyltransferase [Candidatus Thermoplasmatota archaeon]
MNIRNTRESDYAKIISVINDWWGGRKMADMLPHLFFEHFQNTSFVFEENDQLIAFLVGFVSQTRPTEAYIHFVGVHPEYRKSGLARKLYEMFFARVHSMGCDTVHCVTSPVNQGSVAFHARMGFSASLALDYDGPGQDRVLFAKTLND